MSSSGFCHEKQINNLENFFFQILGKNYSWYKFKKSSGWNWVLHGPSHKKNLRILFKNYISISYNCFLQLLTFDYRFLTIVFLQLLTFLYNFLAINYMWLQISYNYLHLVMNFLQLLKFSYNYLTIAYIWLQISYNY